MVWAGVLSEFANKAGGLLSSHYAAEQAREDKELELQRAAERFREQLDLQRDNQRQIRGDALREKVAEEDRVRQQIMEETMGVARGRIGNDRGLLSEDERAAFNEHADKLAISDPSMNLDEARRLYGAMPSREDALKNLAPTADDMIQARMNLGHMKPEDYVKLKDTQAERERTAQRQDALDEIREREAKSRIEANNALAGSRKAQAEKTAQPKPEKPEKPVISQKEMYAVINKNIGDFTHENLGEKVADTDAQKVYQEMMSDIFRTNPDDFYGMELKVRARLLEFSRNALETGIKPGTPAYKAALQKAKPKLRQ